MYLWDIRGLASRIRQKKLSKPQVALYCFLSPLLSISKGTYYLFYRLSTTPEQFKKAYPRFSQFISVNKEI